MERDNQLFELIEDERLRQLHGIELIASENFVSDQVREAMGSVLTNKYAEGYPGKRYYGGCQVVDLSEQLAIDRAKALFGIPGNIGGAVKMNAGAFGVDIADFIQEVTVLNENGIKKYSKADLFFSYRKTSFSFNDDVILEVVFAKADTKCKMQTIEGSSQSEFRKKHLERKSPNLGSTMATKNINYFLFQSKKMKFLAKAINSLPSRVLFKIAEKALKKNIPLHKRLAIIYLLKNANRSKTLNYISDKTMNTFCFNNKEKLSKNKTQYQQYCKTIYEISSNNLEEEIVKK